MDAAPAADEVRSTCPYCGVGCGTIVRTEGAGEARRVVDVRGDPAHPANFGRLCTKGATLAKTQRVELVRPGRLLVPTLRTGRAAPRARLGWDDALDHAADRFADCIARHGPDSVAFYVSGQLLTEDYYVFNKLARAVAGTNNIDSNSRLCMSSAVAGYRRTLGADAPPACYEDLDLAGCLFIAGSNAAWAHPVLMRRIEDARRARPEMKIVVVDPRRTDTAELADLHLPILPGTDVALCHAMLHAMLWEGWVDRAYVDAHTEGFDALRAVVRDCTPAWAAEVCGVPAESIVTAARWFATAGPTLSLYCQGLNQSTSGTAKNAALIGLHLATGQIGRPGAGPLSLTGQPNAMGGRETGTMANLLPGHRDPSDAHDRAEMARRWGVAELPATPGLTAVELFEAIGAGRVRCVWIACTNPVQSLPDSEAVRTALAAAEFVVLQEAYSGTATEPFADLLLPASTWPEKSGTVTNSERRVSRVRAALPPPGEARADWAIAADFARRLQARLPGRGEARFDWDGPGAVWDEWRALTAGRDLDLSGLSWDVLERDGPQQWPYPEGAGAGRARLYEDGRFATASGRARFAADPWRAVAEPPDARRPLRLLTGRTRDAWHGGSRTGLVPQLFAHDPEPSLQLAPVELERRGLVEGELVEVESRRGALTLPVRASGTLRAGQAFVSMHWGPEWLRGGVNGLTLGAIDPVSKQPELKHAAVSVRRAALPYRLTAVGRVAPHRHAEVREALRACFGDSGHASCVPFGRDDAGWALRLASASPFGDLLPCSIAAAFGFDPGALLRYEDRRFGRLRWLGAADGRLAFALAAGAGGEAEEPEASRLRSTVVDATPLRSLAALLDPSAADALPRARTVCSCVGVTDRQILEFVARTGDRRLDAVQSALSCGTGCGSCRVEVARLLAGAPATPAAAA
ncbi:MAG: nitrate reductase [Burkholderiales bacterium]|nr:MAG: nitrate reductase [Burkholderiales bacterium]